MRALYWSGSGWELRGDMPEPEPAAGWVRLRVTCAGICGTDLELMRGYRRFIGIPGHEFVGVVEEGDSAWAGRRVTAATR